MGLYETNSRAGPDRMLHITVPAELAGVDLRITIEPATNGLGTHVPPGSNGAPVPHAPRTREEWRRFAESTAGSMPDFPDVERPGPASYEKRDWRSTSGTPAPASPTFAGGRHRFRRGSRPKAKTLVTHNTGEFRRVPGLAVEDWQIGQ